ncbi:MAG: diaminopimelate decarboxylase [Prolixibacteraceae bacterium]|jgi:diaminopimelate decarboxylase|nr:diaminopimelate decarboxylase [Prolixibacteraceae bacterium]MBT6763129.1 diaminopimelate decarboxylase [Prolixibacteraceae bacterium]MBT6999231.1 diaminopimelate decarboxylase [Prolixibacteraceae bacterium]MBT7393286.1 diaminopimelate decarboxylase [Prolixibacteraceae bacterium]
MSKLKYEKPVISKITAGVPNKFGLPAKQRIISEIDGIPVPDLMEEYGSPVFVLSEKTIRDTYAEAKQAFETRYPKVQFAWSYKTNYLDAVCNVFHDEGSWAEVVSGFEFEKALSNGVNGSNIIFNGPEKSEEDLTLAINNNACIHIDHFDELYLLIETTRKLNKKARVAIRINLDAGIYPIWDRFGFNYENGEAWNAINRIMLADNLEMIGLHTHIGTYIMVASAYAIAASKLSNLYMAIHRKFDHWLKYIDLGGGFASKNTLKGAYMPGSETCPSFDEYAEAISNAIISSEIPHENLPVLFMETGRALIDDAGYLLTTVLANKRSTAGRRTMVIDAGVNLLFTSFWYNLGVFPSKEVSTHVEESTIYGPLCMNIDVIRDAINFPSAKTGDQLVIERVGAYNMTQWMQFITFRPNVVMIDLEGKAHIIRRKENLDSLQSFEVKPNK